MTRHRQCLRYNPSVVLISLVVWSTVSGDPTTHYIRGDYGWCEPILCPAGTQAVLCTHGTPHTTWCEPCPPDTYQDRPTASQDGLRCRARRVCSENGGMEYVTETEDPTADNVCRCYQPFYQDPDYDPRNPQVSPKNCRYCPGDSQYLDYGGFCVVCNFTISKDEYFHKSCVINSVSPVVDDSTTDTPIHHISDQPQVGQSSSPASISPGTTVTPLPPSASPSISVPAICGIVIVTLVTIVTIVLVIWWLQRKRKRDNARKLYNAIPSKENGVHANGGPHCDMIVEDEVQGTNNNSDPKTYTHDDDPTSTISDDTHNLRPTETSLETNSYDFQSHPVTSASPALPNGYSRQRLEAECRINAHRMMVVNDLFVDGPIDKLMQDNVLTAEDAERIRKSDPTSPGKARLLLYTIFKKPKGAELFIDSLSESHGPLHQLLNSTVVTEAAVQNYVNQLKSTSLSF